MSGYPPWQSIRGLQKPLPILMHHEFDLITLLTEYIDQGRPLDAMTLIDRLLTTASTRHGLSMSADLRVLRNVAELELARQLVLRQRLGSDQGTGASGGTVETFQKFAERILPALQHRGCGSQPTLLSGQSAVDRCWRGPEERAQDLLPDRALTEREFEVLHLVAIGKSNLKIAQTLFISEQTVKKHLSRILAKLGAENRTEAVALARRKGILD